MAKEKNIEYKDIDEKEVAKKLLQERDKIIADWSKAYLAETALLPSEVILSCKQIKNGNETEVIYEFRRKNESEGKQ